MLNYSDMVVLIKRQSVYCLLLKAAVVASYCQRNVGQPPSNTTVLRREKPAGGQCCQ